MEMIVTLVQGVALVHMPDKVLGNHVFWYKYTE